MLFLDIQNVIAAHDEIIETTGGERGVLAQGMLEACLERHLTYVFGFEPYRGLFEKAAALMHCIIYFHPFIDGNKRGGIVVAASFLRLSGYVLRIQPEDSIAFTLKVSRGLAEIAEIAQWLLDNSVFVGE